MTHNHGGGLGLVVCAVFKTAGRRPRWLRWVRFPHAPATAALLVPTLAAGGCYVVEDVPWDAQRVADVGAVLAAEGLWPVTVIRSGKGEHAAVVARAGP